MTTHLRLRALLTAAAAFGAVALGTYACSSTSPQTLPPPYEVPEASVGGFFDDAGADAPAPVDAAHSDATADAAVDGSITSDGGDGGDASPPPSDAGDASSAHDGGDASSPSDAAPTDAHAG